LKLFYLNKFYTILYHINISMLSKKQSANISMPILIPLNKPSYNLPNSSPTKNSPNYINEFSEKQYKLQNDSSPPNVSGSPPNEFMDNLRVRMQNYYEKK
jgi:hypothetical protein